jgi:ribosomal protein S18 acetylase RimI-like enzyme
MIRTPKIIDFDSLYTYYKEKTTQENTYVLLDLSRFKDIVNRGFLALDERESSIYGFILGHFRNDKSYISLLYGNSYDSKDSLIQFYDQSMIDLKIKETYLHFFNPVSLPWYPIEDIVHPCFQGVIVGSENEVIYLKNHYIVNSIQDTYYRDLKKFEIPESIKEQTTFNQKDGYEITIYDQKKHLKILEFTENINAPHWKNVILENINRKDPLPILVALKDNQVIGFAGPLRVEENGRGYFAGIGVLETERGKKIGKTLFFMLCQTLKNMGSSYMTLFTGRENAARFIYLSAGFKVVKSFNTMKKTYY